MLAQGGVKGVSPAMKSLLDLWRIYAIVVSVLVAMAVIVWIVLHPPFAD
jgi:hypothetical protein